MFICFLEYNIKKRVLRIQRTPKNAGSIVVTCGNLFRRLPIDHASVSLIVVVIRLHRKVIMENIQKIVSMKFCVMIEKLTCQILK